MVTLLPRRRLVDNFLPLCDPPAAGGDDLHLVLCPFAGGSAGAFRSWRDLCPTDMRLSMAVYPGRDYRMNEPCLTSINALSCQVQAQIMAARIDTNRLVLAGHSMGAQIAYEVCAALERLNLPPCGLVLSGCHAPHLRGRRLLGHLEDQAFIEQLHAIGGCGPELLGEPGLWPVFIPMLRADFQATENYQYEQVPAPAQRLRTRSLLICGSSDQEALFEEVDAWRDWLLDAQGPVTIAGDHFYITRRPRAFLEHVRHCFDQYQPGNISRFPANISRH